MIYTALFSVEEYYNPVFISRPKHTTVHNVLLLSAAAYMPKTIFLGGTVKFISFILVIQWVSQVFHNRDCEPWNVPRV